MMEGISLIDEFVIDIKKYLKLKEKDPVVREEFDLIKAHGNKHDGIKYYEMDPRRLALILNEELRNETPVYEALPKNINGGGHCRILEYNGYFIRLTFMYNPCDDVMIVRADVKVEKR